METTRIGSRPTPKKGVETLGVEAEDRVFRVLLDPGPLLKLFVEMNRVGSNPELDPEKDVKIFGDGWGLK